MESSIRIRCRNIEKFIFSLGVNKVVGVCQHLREAPFRFSCGFPFEMEKDYKI